MDPIATLRELLDALLRHDAGRATEIAEHLDEWLRRGGFAPLQAHRQPDYQGWKNHPTWAVHLWLTGSQESDLRCLSLAADAIHLAPRCGQVREGTWRIEEAPRLLLADQLKELVDSRNPLGDEGSLYSDLLGSALYQVDWIEVAEAFLERTLDHPAQAARASHCEGV